MTSSDTANDEVVLTVQAQDGQYHLRTTPETNNPWPGSAEGLIAGETGWVAVLCGTQFGPVQLTARGHEQPPPIDTSWDMAVEWTLDCPDGKIDVSSIYSGEPQRIDAPEDLLRVRVSVRGRAQASTLVAPPASPVESHRLDYWPTTASDTAATVVGPDELAQHLI